MGDNHDFPHCPMAFTYIIVIIDKTSLHNDALLPRGSNGNRNDLPND